MHVGVEKMGAVKGIGNLALTVAASLVLILLGIIYFMLRQYG